MFQAIYLPDKDAWLIKDIISSKDIFEYTIDMVPLGFVVGVAALNGKLSRGDYQRFVTTGLEEHEVKELLDWFLHYYWKSPAMGATLIEDLREIINVYMGLIKENQEKVSSVVSIEEIVKAISNARKSQVEKYLGIKG